MTRVPQDDEQALQEAERREVVEVALHASRSSCSGSDVRLAADPGDEGLRGGLVLVEGGPAVGAQRRGKSRSRAGHVGESALHEGIDGLTEHVGIAGCR